MSDIPIPNPAKKMHTVPDVPTLSVGGFFAEHRAAIDARKTHLERVGISNPQTAAHPGPLVAGPHEVPSQAKVLAMPAREDPLLMALPEHAVPETPPAKYESRKLPALPGVNVDLSE